MCKALDVPKLRDSVRIALGCDVVSDDMRNFASIFWVLQESRHRADYDPQAEVQLIQAIADIDSAQLAIDAFNRTPPDEQADVLALMMVKART